MIVTDPEDIELLRQAGKLAGEVLSKICQLVAPGISTWELDQVAEQTIVTAGAVPTFKGYRNFPATICSSVNEEVVHGIPSKHKILKEGDVISLDIGVTIRQHSAKGKRDFIGDTAVTIPVGAISPRLEKLIADTQIALYAGIKAACAGAVLDEIGGAIEDIAKGSSYGIVREYGGHGIGYNYHEEPFILNYRSGSRTKLKPGMVIAIEPMFNQGGDHVKLKSDGWTVVTQDYKPSAHFEHSVLIREKGEPEVLTKRANESL